MMTAPQTWRFIDSPATSGWENMAVDIVLAKNTSKPTLRFYTWNPWTISLGLHQNEQDIDIQKCNKAGIGVVRRPTGGRAIFHAEELTYSVTLPKSHPWFAESVNAVYKQISDALLAGIQLVGVAAQAQTSASAHTEYTEDFACFAISVNYEIAVAHAKLIGSAQRRYKKGLLQHGSILLGPAHEQLNFYRNDHSGTQSALHTQSTCLAQVLGYQPEIENVKKAILTGFEMHLNCRFEHSDLTSHEHQRVSDLTTTLKKGDLFQ